MASFAVAVAVAQEIKQAGTEVPPPKRTKFIAPVYPPAAQASGQRGIVILELVVDPQGKVESVNVVRSVPPFDEAAVTAVRQWEYEITKVDGRPVAVRLTVPITFALRLPTVVRAPGVPELRMGAAPGLPPEPWGRNEAIVEADVTLDPDGQVTDALVTSGESPWAEALLQALRTWRFVGSPAEGPLTFKAKARFLSAAQGTPRVDLELSDPRRAAAPPAGTEAADAAAGATAAAAATPVAKPPDTASPAPPPAIAPPVAVPGAPAAAPPSGTPGAAPPSAAPPAAPGAAPPATAPSAPPTGAAPPAAQPTAPPVTQPAATPPTSATAPPGDAAGKAPAPTTGGQPQAPPVEVVPPAPPPPPPPEGGGGSAVRGIQLATGVPDLVSGRRPVVPPLARLKAVAGKVTVRFAVDASGATSSAEAEGTEPLREAARQAVASWVFRRTRADRIRMSAEFDYGTENATAIVTLEP